MSDDFDLPDRSQSYGMMIAGHSAVTHAVRSLDAALYSVERAARAGIPTNGPTISMARVEADLREILARVEAVNARRATETREAA